MKKSDLKTIGEFRLTPDAWGSEIAVMLDEAAAAASMAEAFGLPVEECDPDRYENSTPEEIELGVDEDGNYFVVFKGMNTGRYQPCENIEYAGASGMLLLEGSSDFFED